MKWYHGLWIAVLVTIATVVAYVLGRRESTLRDTVDLELEVVKVKAGAKRKAAQDGADAARKEIELKYAATMRRLDQERQDEADALRSDPVAFGEYLARAARKI